MIKGIYLETEPKMANVSESDVISELDLLKIAESSHDIKVEENNVERTIYYSDNHYIYVFKFTGDNIDRFNELSKPYEILQKAWPELLKEFKYQDNKMIFAIPRYNTGEDIVYKSMVEELIRFISFFYFTVLENGEDDDETAELMTTEYIKEYIKFAVSTPNNRI